MMADEEATSTNSNASAGVLCSSSYGCGKQNSVTDAKCTQCERELVSLKNKNSISFTMGQDIYFARKVTELFEKGYIVNISQSIVTVKYADLAWQDDKYDEECHVDTIFLTIKDATESMQRSRRQVVPLILADPYPVKAKKATVKPKTKLSNEPTHAVKKEVFTRPANSSKKRTSASDSSILSSSEIGVEPRKHAQKKLCTFVPNKKTYTNLGNVNGDIDSFQHNQLEHYFQEKNVNDLLAAFDLRAKTQKDLRFDRWLHRGILCHLMNWAKPPRSEADKEYLGVHNQYRKPALRVAAFFDLVTHCPLTVDELRDIPSCEFLLKEVSPVVPDRSSLTPNSSRIPATAQDATDNTLYFSDSNTENADTNTERFSSVGEEIVHSLNWYLQSRCRHPFKQPKDVAIVADETSHVTLAACATFRRKCLLVDPANIEPIFQKMNREFRHLNLRLPLSFEHFQIFIEETYNIMGGREIIETGTEIKGCKTVGGIAAMYGGVKEELVDDIVARTRLSRDSKFLDIGSGIGQTCIQVAATVGCLSRGVELDRERYTASRNLLVAFNCLLIEVFFFFYCLIIPVILSNVYHIQQAGVEGGLVQVKFECANFMTRQDLTEWASVIYFNNFGPWFMNPISVPDMEGVGTPNKRSAIKISPMHCFCEQLKESKVGTQLVVLNPLTEAYWLHFHHFGSTPGSASWTDTPLDMYLYTVVCKQVRLCIHFISTFLLPNLIFFQFLLLSTIVDMSGLSLHERVVGRSLHSV